MKKILSDLEIDLARRARCRSFIFNLNLVYPYLEWYPQRTPKERNTHSSSPDTLLGRTVRSIGGRMAVVGHARGLLRFRYSLWTNNIINKINSVEVGRRPLLVDSPHSPPNSPAST
jgi:hypothetical protein